MLSRLSARGPPRRRRTVAHGRAEWVKWAGMAAKKKGKSPKPPAVSAPPKIYEATLASGPSGVVYKGAEIDLDTAIARRKAGKDIVVCGNDIKANRGLAKQIEAAIGPWEQETPHHSAGPHSLPHVQQQSRSPAGHSFYDTPNPKKKARKAP
jgi:hypothetical protein